MLLDFTLYLTSTCCIIPTLLFTATPFSQVTVVNDFFTIALIFIITYLPLSVFSLLTVAFFFTAMSIVTTLCTILTTIITPSPQP